MPIKQLAIKYFMFDGTEKKNLWVLWLCGEADSNANHQFFADIVQLFGNVVAE